eukprot:8290817-Pyramimonas_sp.AAC.2
MASRHRAYLLSGARATGMPEASRRGLEDEKGKGPSVRAIEAPRPHFVELRQAAATSEGGARTRTSNG